MLSEQELREYDMGWWKMIKNGRMIR